MAQRILRLAVVALAASAAVQCATGMAAAQTGSSAEPVGSAAARELPVPHTFLAGAVEEIGNPGGSGPGSNDWSCVPSVEHPNPVVLLHGTAGNRQTNWATYSPALANAGYCVFALTYGNRADLPWPVSAFGALLPADESVTQLSDFVDRVLAATGAAKVDLLTHSQGALIGNGYAKTGGESKVDKIVSLAPRWIRKADADPADPDEVLAARMWEGGLYAPSITYTNITTEHDEIIVPYTSGIVEGPNATNIVVQDGCDVDFSDHLAIAAEPRAEAMVFNALDPAHPRPVPCDLVLPVVG